MKKKKPFLPATHTVSCLLLGKSNSFLEAIISHLLEPKHITSPNAITGKRNMISVVGLESWLILLAAYLNI